MGFASSYLEKHSYYKNFITREPVAGTSLIVVIPSFNEPDVLTSVKSLFNADSPSFPVEVLVVVNSSQNSCQEIILQNRKTVTQLREWSSSYCHDNFMVYVLDVPSFPCKHAGAGFARKTGMDEAVSRFNQLNNERGIIVSFDADSKCDRNYFTELEKCFSSREVKGCTIYFEHPPGSNIKCTPMGTAIIEYELYLRYFVQAMRLAGFPYAFHTIGSCFAVNVKTYAAMGGMNRKTAGEDFYFLHKIFPLGNFTELNSTRVIPSSRISDRVPFGTGATMKRMVAGSLGELKTYPLQSFDNLSVLFSIVPEFFGTDTKGAKDIVDKLPACTGKYLKDNDFVNAVLQMNMHSASLLSFRKRFFVWFNALRLLKFLNYTDKYSYDQPVTQAADSLLRRLNVPSAEEGCSLLQIYRDLQRKTIWKS